MTDNRTLQQKNIEQRKTLSPEKQALLDKRLQGKASAPAARRITAVAAGEVVPVSYSQQRLWFVQQMDPAATWYNRATRLKIIGDFEIDRLQQVVNDILTRHQVLRTTYFMQAGELYQKVNPPAFIRLHQEDFSHLEPAALDERIALLVGQPFDLSRDMLVRLYLFRLGQDEHLFLFVTHHIVFDRWSEEVLVRELAAGYQAGVLPELSIQYPDFAAWQRSAEQVTRLGPHLAYWKNKLGGNLPVLKLPEDHPRPAVQDNQGGSMEISLSADLLRKLKDLARDQGSTLFMLLLAAYKVLLYRNSGETDLIVGSPIAGRLHPEVEPLIGCFINNLVLRSDLSGNPTFAELLGRLRQVTLDAYQHQEVPFELLVRELQISRDMSRAPLFQTMFNFENIPRATHQPDRPAFQLVEVPDRVALYDLSLGLTEQEETLSCNFIYSQALFDPETIQRLARHFLTLLESILANPDERIATLPMLSAAERRQMIVEWNQTRVERPGKQCLHQLFETQVALRPDQIAMIHQDRQVTYGELEQRSNRLAHHLQNMGVRPEVMVGIYLERSPEMIICVLAVLKAGGVFVPLETSHPASRTAAILENSHAPLVLTRQGLVAGLAGYGGRLVLLDAHAAEIDSQPVTPVDPWIDPDNLAYVIHTSGTTGVPKGVLIHHGGASNLIQDMCAQLGIGPGDSILLNFPLSFDVSISQIFIPFTVGGRLILTEADRHNDPSHLLGLVAQHAVTILNTSSSMLENILVEYGLQNYPSLRLVICGAEATSLALVNRFFEQTSINLINIYGPTEVSIAVTFWRCQPGGLKGVVPIGRPMANVRAYVLDEFLQPVPVGVPGELYLAGMGLGRGYLDRPGWTAEKFVPDPFASQPGERMYSSGDLVRYLPDGNIDFLSRVDQQVKIRGFRIELGEIETTLSACPMVRRCALMVREDQPGDKRLVAYVIPDPESRPTSTELRNYLAEKLPAYMLPNHFIFMEKIPLTNNGKANFALLPAPDQSRPELNANFQEAGTPTEAGLASIWKELLGIERIGIHDNFFELGGHSLLAIRMIEMAKDQLGLILLLSAVFEAPSIHQLASILDAENWQPRWSALVALRASGERPPLFLVPPSATTGMRFSRLTELLESSQPVYSFNHPGLDGNQEPQSKMEDIAALYVSEMLAFKYQGPYLLGGMCFGVQVALEMAQQLKQRGIEPAMLIFLDPGNPQKGEKYVQPSKKGARHYARRIGHHIGKGTLLRITARNISSRIFKLNKSIKANKYIRQTNQCHLEAIKNYQSMPYNGRVIFIQNGDRKEKLVSKWKEILTGQVDHHDISNSTHKTFLKKEKFIQAIAGLLNKALDDFHTSQSKQTEGAPASGSSAGEIGNG